MGRWQGNLRPEAIDLDTGERLVFVSINRLAFVSQANWVFVEAGSVSIADMVVTFWKRHKDCGGEGPRVARSGRVRVGRWRVPIRGNEWLVDRGWAALYATKGHGDERTDDE